MEEEIVILGYVCDLVTEYPFQSLSLALAISPSSEYE